MRTRPRREERRRVPGVHTTATVSGRAACKSPTAGRFRRRVVALRCTHLTYEADYGKFRVSTRSQIYLSYRKIPLRGGLRPSGRGCPPERSPVASPGQPSAAGCMCDGLSRIPRGMLCQARALPLEPANRPDWIRPPCPGGADQPCADWMSAMGFDPGDDQPSGLDTATVSSVDLAQPCAVWMRVKGSTP